jgi:hypothetical protein
MKISRRFVNLKTIVLMASSLYKWLVITPVIVAGFFDVSSRDFSITPQPGLGGLILFM